MVERREHGERRHAAQRAQRATEHRVAQVAQQHLVGRAILSRHHAVDHLHATRGADAAGRALATGFDGAELHRIARHVCHVDGVVEYHDAAVADHRALGGEGLVVERHVELRCRDVGAERAADLHRADGAAARRAAADVVEHLAQREAERLFHEAAVLHVAGELEGERALGAAHAEVAVELRAAIHDDRDARERDHIVDHRGLAEEAFDGRQRRLEAHHAALALEAFEERRFLAADVRPCTAPHLELERRAGAEQVRAEETAGLGDLDRGLQRRFGVRILGAHVDVALRGAGGHPRDRHALDERERIAFHQHAIGEGAGVALVGIAHDVFLRAPGRRRRLPLDAGGEGRTAASAQAGLEDFLDRGLGADFQGPREAASAAVRAVVIERQRIGDAHARERQALLVLEIGNLLGEAEVQAMRGPAEKSAAEEVGGVLRRDRPIGDAAGRGDDLHQGLQPEHAAGAVAHDLHVGIAAHGLVGDGARDLLGATRQCRGIAGDVDRGGHGLSPRHSATMASKASLSTHARRSMPSTITAGEQAQLPRQ